VTARGKESVTNVASDSLSVQAGTIFSLINNAAFVLEVFTISILHMDFAEMKSY